MEDKLLGLNSESMIMLINEILSNIKSDRNAALAHHNMLNSLLQGVNALEMDSLEATILLKEQTAAVLGFLTKAGKSTDDMIKLTKLILTYVNKNPEKSGLSETDRDGIEDMVERQQKLRVVK